MSQKNANQFLSGSNYQAANEQGKDWAQSVEDDRSSMNAHKIGEMKKINLMDNADMLIPPTPVVHKIKDDMKYFSA